MRPADLSSTLLLLFLLLVPAVLATCNSPISSGFDCTVTTKTRDCWLCGTNSGVFIVFRGISGAETSRIPLDVAGNDFGYGAEDQYTVTVSNPSVTPLRGISMYIDGNDQLDLQFVKVFCQNGEISQYHYFYDQIDKLRGNGAHVDKNGGDQITCSGLPSIANGRVSCTNSNIWGSRCTYSCNDNFLLQSSSPGAVCTQCSQYNAWRGASNEVAKCTELCHWRRSHCWPGQCSGPTGQQLAQTCSCEPGFKLTTSNGSRCDLDTLPDLNVCRVAVTDSQGTSTNSSYTGNITSCGNQRDEYINTVPVNVYFAITADLDLTANGNQSYIGRSPVGVIGIYVTVVKKSLSGTGEIIVTPEMALKNTPKCQHNVSVLAPALQGTEHDCEGPIDISHLTLQDGDSLCVDMKASAGGFYEVNNNAGILSSTETFTPTSATKRVCFLYDTSKPIHCSASPNPPVSCLPSFTPLTLSTRITRQPEIQVSVEGWLDYRPPGGVANDKSASDVRRYRLEVHEVNVGPDRLNVEDAALPDNFTQTFEVGPYLWTSTAGPTTFNVILPQSNAARLYALIVEVHDNAGNVGYARRMVLYDNSSSLEFMPQTSLSVVHANPRSNYQWQTDVSMSLCVNWTGHFYNTDLRNNNFLMPVQTDTRREIYDQYDQATGVLPVNGTDNVMGVTKFELSWNQNSSTTPSPYTEVSDVSAQHTCLQLQQALQDGETYDISVKATDIMNNTKEDSVRVSIDHTGPEVSVWGLRGRWDTDQLYVHNSTDLSKMRLVVTAQDPHSGLATILWKLGTQPLASDLGNGAVAVQRVHNVTSCAGLENCYCPSVGECENFHYTLIFPSLVASNTHLGDHHREYYVTVTVTNVASLSSNAASEILLDESPPTVGVVWEGLSLDGQAEMDFTSSHEVQARWHGYEDHQSGMRLYRAVLAQRCLTAAEVDGAQNATEVQHPDNMASFSFPSEGHYYVSVVGYNNAMQPSEVACSDGITYDTTPPALVNVSIPHARSGHMVGCTQQGKAWLVNSNLTRVELAVVGECSAVCSANSSAADVEHLPLSSNQNLDPQLSRRYCRNLPIFAEDSVLVLPSDYLLVTWQAIDLESDMEEYYIGMGGDRTSWSAPDLLPFTPTHGQTSYHARHAGLSHGDVFFVFLQAVNKAGLSANLTLGPVLIDVTPHMNCIAAVEDARKK